MNLYTENANPNPIRVLLIGSYNGQDSLGDVCLLKSIIAHLSEHLDAPEFILHSNSRGVASDKIFGKTMPMVCDSGLQSIFWWWRNKWRHTFLPVPAYTVLAGMTFPVWLLLSLAWAGSSAHRVLKQIVSADLIFIFGGTNFSRQWFSLNIPYYILTSLIARLFGARVYWGPQQYGPMARWQMWVSRAWCRFLVHDFRTRNVRCLDELGVPDWERSAKLAWDEVYSNTGLYPQRSGPGRGGTNGRILLNIRGGDLSTDDAFTRERIAKIVPLLKAVAKKLDSEYVFFAVSGDSFCDDEHSYHVLKMEFAGTGIELVPRFNDESELIELAAAAVACISMSFHGCILSGMAGIPSVPISAGEYYDYKYADFSRYGDGREVPVIHLGGDQSESTISRVVAYIQDFSPDLAAQQRNEAAVVARAFYAGIGRDARG